MKALGYIVGLALVLLSFSGKAFAGERAATASRTTPLVEVYCSEFVQRLYRGDASELGEDREAWHDLVRRLESRDPVPEARELDPAMFERCVASHRAEFQEGEFILGGKQLLGTGSRSPQTASPAATSVPTPKAGDTSTEVSLPGLGKLRVDLPVERRKGELLPKKARVETLGSETAREARYDELWREFLDKVHGQFAPRRASAGQAPDLR